MARDQELERNDALEVASPNSVGPSGNTLQWYIWQPQLAMGMHVRTDPGLYPEPYPQVQVVESAAALRSEQSSREEVRQGVHTDS